MARQVEAVFEEGVLRPLEPLSLPENKRVLLTISDVLVAETNGTRRAEQVWLSAHSASYRGQWVALEGDRLLSHGPKARLVRDEARRKGVARPLLVRVPENLDQPSAGWL